VTGVVELVFETHALTTDNERGIATGWLGGSLSARGRGLAAELGTRRRNDRIDEVLCSDLARAVETSEIAFGGPRYA
jgi:2,3-bisphosphoglycerate-dependent phosphoglycerate mutase